MAEVLVKKVVLNQPSSAASEQAIELPEKHL